MASVATRSSIKALHPLFVAEVTGVDLTAPLSPEEKQTIWQAFNDHQILVFRDQPLDDQLQMRFSRNFGDLERMEAHAANDYMPGHIAIMTNLDANGVRLPLDHPAMIHRERNEMWHTDSSFKPIGALASLLHARIVPPVGGDTDFASSRSGYEALSAERKAALAELKVIHRVIAPNETYDTKGARRRAEEASDRRASASTHQPRHGPQEPLRRLTCAGGDRDAAQEGRALLDELTALCTQQQFVYTHVWRLHDLVMWDNRSTLHRATTFDKTKHERKMHRTTVAGRSPDEAMAAMP